MLLYSPTLLDSKCGTAPIWHRSWRCFILILICQIVVGERRLCGTGYGRARWQVSASRSQGDNITWRKGSVCGIATPTCYSVCVFAFRDVWTLMIRNDGEREEEPDSTFVSLTLRTHQVMKMLSMPEFVDFYS